MIARMLEMRHRLKSFSDEILTAWRSGSTMTPLSERGCGLTIDDAYRISLDVIERRCADGERVIGKKIGVTSRAVQEMLGVHQPDFGYLTDRMRVQGSIDIAHLRLIQPRAEAEIAFLLRDRLLGPGVSADDVIAATESIAPCFEIVDSRIEDWRIGIVDTVADNASCGVFVLGDARADPKSHDLAALRVSVIKNGEPLSEGVGSAVQGSPAQSVAWLANTLGRYGMPLEAGDIVLSGSLVPLATASPGDVFEMELHGVGGCVARFNEGRSADAR